MSANSPMNEMFGARAMNADTAIIEMAERIGQAARDKTSLRIVGGDTKAFYGRQVAGQAFHMNGYAGIVSYESSELVITAKSGTPIVELESQLEREGQMLGFEPPHFGAGSTVGGVVASGLSGPGRPYRGAVRDFVLGVDVINGRGQALRFGGQVMKNVAGFDVSRLMAGSLGTLGVITQVSLRVLPRPQRQATLIWDVGKAEARAHMLRLAREPWPITAMVYDGMRLRIRVSGSNPTVTDALDRLNPAASRFEDDYWRRLRDLDLPFFEAKDTSIWRLSLPPAAPDPDVIDNCLWDWGGAQRWLSATTHGDELQRYCETHGGHALCFRNQNGASATEPFMQPAPALQAVFTRLKHAFDPDGIFNPGRHYAWM